MQPLPFQNSYAQLPEHFFTRTLPEPVASPSLVQWNAELAAELDLEVAVLDDAALARIFSGNQVPEGADPLAMAYAGHQFGQFVPRLGDGRALLLGEVIDGWGRRRDIQLKGAGRTPFGRGGDGRAPVGPAMREYLVSETMHALGVPTTRALALVTTGERVMREGMPPGAVLTRVAASHIRVGTFQYFAARGDKTSVRTLADYVIQRHYPELAEDESPYLALIDAVGRQQARLVADWMSVGFIHGVMNTDNVSLAGETLDYGPCAFMDTYHPDIVFSSIDAGGRYAYSQQPNIARWNLVRFVETLLPLLHDDESEAIERAATVINEFPALYEQAWLDRMRAKLGLGIQEPDDEQLIADLLVNMSANEVDFTLLFRRLCDAAEDAGAMADVQALFCHRPREWQDWAARWRQRLARESDSPENRAAKMRAVNPAVIPRNHRIEQAIEQAARKEDFTDFKNLYQRLRRPFKDEPEDPEFLGPPAPEERVLRTFCGT